MAHWLLSSRRLADIAALTRLANLPTLWSCVLASWLFGESAFAQSSTALSIASLSSRPDAWGTLLITGLVASLLYLAGTLANDWKDVHWDQRHRPERALPAGRMSRPAVGVAALFSVATALLLLRELPRQSQLLALGLVLAIGLYTLLHKQQRFAALSVLLMALCRALLALFALSTSALSRWSWQQLISLVGAAPLHMLAVLFAYPLALALWTTVISLIAQKEHLRGRAALLPVATLSSAALLAALLPALALFALSQTSQSAATMEKALFSWLWPGLLGAILALAWVGIHAHMAKRREQLVAALLPAFCLLDASFIAAVYWPAALACLLLFVLSLALQKVGAAT